MLYYRKYHNQYAQINDNVEYRLIYTLCIIIKTTHISVSKNKQILLKLRTQGKAYIEWIYIIQNIKSYNIRKVFDLHC